MTCLICGEPCHMTPWGPAGDGGVCRYPDDPNQDDQGQHVVERWIETLDGLAKCPGCHQQVVAS